MVGAGTAVKYLFDLRPGDMYWCTADCGWITGHTFLTYGPMLNGVTQVCGFCVCVGGWVGGWLEGGAFAVARIAGLHASSASAMPPASSCPAGPVRVHAQLPRPRALLAHH